MGRAAGARRAARSSCWHYGCRPPSPPAASPSTSSFTRSRVRRACWRSQGLAFQVPAGLAGLLWVVAGRALAACKRRLLAAHPAPPALLPRRSRARSVGPRQRRGVPAGRAGEGGGARGLLLDALRRRGRGRLRAHAAQDESGGPAEVSLTGVLVLVLVLVGQDGSGCRACAVKRWVTPPAPALAPPATPAPPRPRHWLHSESWWPRLFRHHGEIAWDDYEKDYSDLPEEVLARHRCGADARSDAGAGPATAWVLVTACGNACPSPARPAPLTAPWPRRPPWLAGWLRRSRTASGG